MVSYDVQTTRYCAQLGVASTLEWADWSLPPGPKRNRGSAGSARARNQALIRMIKFFKKRRERKARRAEEKTREMERHTRDALEKLRGMNLEVRRGQPGAPPTGREESGGN